MTNSRYVFLLEILNKRFQRYITNFRCPLIFLIHSLLTLFGILVFLRLATFIIQFNFIFFVNSLKHNINDYAISITYV
jgi:fatty-acid desaturase